MPPTTPLPMYVSRRAVNRHRRGLGDLGKHLVGKDHATPGHGRVAHVEDQAVGGQRLERREHLRQRRFIAVGQGHPAREGGQRRLHALLVTLEVGRVRHHVDTLGCRMELQRQVHRFDLRGFPHDAGDARDLALEHLAGRRRGGKDNRHVWKQFVAMPQHELQRRRAVRDQHVERTIAELDAGWIRATTSSAASPNSSFSRYSASTPRPRWSDARYSDLSDRRVEVACFPGTPPGRHE